MKRLFVLFILIFAAASGFTQSRVSLSLGHAGSVQSIAAHPTRPLAFTTGNDGRLIVWDLELRALRHRYQISHNPVTHAVHHPERDEVALVVSDHVDRASIRVIEWETGDELFRYELESTPLDLVYSPQGTYLIALLPNFRSLLFLSADTGAPRAYLDDGFGIVNFVQMGSSERNIMTYVPSRGEFIYWSLQSGEELQKVRTTERLRHLTLVDPENRRALAGATENEMVVVDNLTGQTRATYPIRPIHDIQYDEENGRISVLTEQFGRRIVLSFTYSNGRLRRDFYQPSGLDPETTTLRPLTPGSRYFMAGDERGEVDVFDARSGRNTKLGPRPVVPILDVAFTDGRLHMSLGDRILSLVSDGLQSGSPRLQISSIRATVASLPGVSDARLEQFDNGVFVWGETTPSGSVFLLSPPSTNAQPYYEDEEQNPVLEVRQSARGPIVIHRDGRIIQLSSEFAVERFQYVARGAQAASWKAEFGLVVAKTRSSNFDSSVIRVDEITRETVPIRSGAFLSTDVAFGDGPTLYAIGLFGSTNAPKTRLLRFSGERFESQSQLAEYDGEDPEASVMWDDQTKSLYTTLGYDGLKRFEGRREVSMDSSGQIAREVAAGGFLVAAVNMDGSVSLWNRETGEFLVDLYVLEGDQWIALTQRGAFYSSSATTERYLDFIPGERTGLSLDDFRISLPYRE